MRIAQYTILVEDIDAAVKFYTEKLGFVKRLDTVVWVNLRWVTVSPKDQPDVQLNIALADEADKLAVVGKQTPGHVLMFLETDDMPGDYNTLKNRGVNFIVGPEDREWGKEAVFEDLYGNIICLIQLNKNMPNSVDKP